jgi:catechol 2,3-dioxygenase-like lactoylglutathione lyase family enzyme
VDGGAGVVGTTISDRSCPEQLSGIMRATASTLAIAIAFLVSLKAVHQPATPARPRITGISHVAFRVSDAAAARKFYGGVLGLTEHAAPDGSRITFSIGNRQRVMLESGLRAEDEERLAHLAFETSDIKALGAYLASRGVLPPEGGRTSAAMPPCDPSAIRVTDPDGHPIEFVEARWPPGQPTPDPAGAISRRLLHAGLTIRDEEAAHRFYRDTLGFSEIWRGGRKEGVTQWVNMRLPDGTDYLEYMLIAAGPDRRQRGVLHHAALMVSDMQDAWEEAVRRSPDTPQTRLSPPQVGVNGRWQLNLFDPDGTRIELMEPFRVR